MQKSDGFYITDQHQRILDTIVPYTNGLASFDFIPADSVDYFLKVKYTNSEPQLIRFPEIADSGFSIKTEVLGSKLICHIAKTPGLSAHDEKFYFKIISENEFTLGTQFLKNESDTQTVKIPLSWSDKGILHAVLMTTKHDILQYSSLYYVSPLINIELPIKLDKKQYTRRELITGKIIAIPGSSFDTAFLTVSVVKSGTTEDFADTLPWQYIENPRYAVDFFSGKKISSEIHHQLEIASILKNPVVFNTINRRVHKGALDLVYLPEFREVIVSGSVRDKKTGMPVEGASVYSTVLFHDFQLHGSETGSDGSFIFSLNNLTGNHDLYFCTRPKGEQEQEILINSDFSNDFPDVSDAFRPPDSSSARFIEELWTNLQLSRHFPDDSAVQCSPHKQLPFLFGEEMITKKLDDYISLGSMKEVFNEIIPFVKLKETDGHYQLSVFNTRTEMIFHNPLILLDNIPFIDPDEIMKIHPSLIDNIGVIDKVYVLGNNVFQGVISVTTKTVILPGSASLQAAYLPNTRH